MAKSSPEFLQALEQRAREKQEQFMINIAGRLGRSCVTVTPAHPFKGAPEFWRQYELEQDERIERFMENWRKVGGHAFCFDNMEGAKSFIVQQSRDMKAKYVLRQNQQELNELALEADLPEMEIAVWDGEQPAEMKAKAAGADIGIVYVDYAAAYTGSIVVKSAGFKGRSVSLLPTALFAIIPVERLKTRLGEVMAEIETLPQEEMPAGIHFISGPSRSADIENDLTIGVHGPGVVYALLVK